VGNHGPAIGHRLTSHLKHEPSLPAWKRRFWVQYYK